MLEATVKSRIVDELEKIVGSEYVSTNKADLYIYSKDMTQAEPSWPDVVVLPKSVEEVQAVVRLANKNKIPITPYVAGGNIGGLTIPLKGGISLDLRRMNRILEVNETDMYAVVEPGFTFGMMKAFLDKHHPDLVYSYAFSPPSTGIVSNCITQGLNTYSFRYGVASNWVSGLEVVLANGDLVRIGSCAVSNIWQAVAPMPELTGLFLGWQGTTGIITKMAVSLWPKPKHAVSLNLLLMDLEGTYEFFKEILRTRVPDDMICNSAELMQLSMLSMQQQKVSLYPAIHLGPDVPKVTVSMEVSGNTEDELNAKVKVIEKVIKEKLKEFRLFVPPETAAPRPISWDGNTLNPVPSERGVSLPFQSVFILSSGGGLTWVGAYGPMSNWLETARKGCEIQNKYDLSRSLYSRIMNEGHFAGIRWMIPYDKEDPEMIKRVEDMSLEQLNMVLDMGYVPYKTPFWAIRKIEEKASPEWLELHRKIKKLMDPNNILNPGRWGAPAE